MKPSGIVRQIDELGRLVLPKEIRKTLQIEPKDSLEFWLDNDCIVLKKYAPTCVFCQSAKNIVRFKDKNVCARCIKEISDD